MEYSTPNDANGILFGILFSPDGIPCGNTLQGLRRIALNQTLIVHTKNRPDLAELPGWDQLEPKEMELVRSESQSLSEALYFERKSRAQVGKHLIALRSILEPKRLWYPFLQNGFGMSKSTAYNYINDYVTISGKLPAPFVEIAMRNGYNLRPEMLTKAPPPNTDDPIKIVAYLDKITEKPRPRPVIVRNDPPDAVLRDCVNFVAMKFKRLPRKGKVRERFITDFFGMTLGRLGVSERRTFSPVATPEAFKPRKVGRPRKKVA